ncbi:glycosyl transferase family 9 [Solidesulfovibrio carbinoliphilus subsp. oakridgensis]|uniref:Glycosyl transferase family 9 n=1 Tax=Solidesulfovibrio carbinoliphilus subsp. oakridgensis TaxID=694327 RepID=G7QDL6_9BACT|nr:glycosyltransferase family 9 protein [Solidesulfovibrio carbinoliphilus]EHJ46522.1 glycosyl transferase family 9 [Solidesulfovibrio carbinoliphilus subsp. oakridgensis]
MEFPDKIVLEHGGALGDFLLAWPAFISVSRHFSNRPVHFAAPSSHRHWLSPLGTPCPPDILRGLGARFEGETWPEALAGTLVVRPGLGLRPDLPDWTNFWFLPGLAPGRDDPPTTLYREALAVRDIPFATDSPLAFRALFGGHAPTGNTVLLFPGAGHRDKAWPLPRFERLAEVLRDYGLRPVFVMGPAELERDMRPANGEMLAPGDLVELSEAIRSARFVVGPDCGPLHLAGLSGVPGLALFGPTSPCQWAPAGLEVVTAGLPCSPCTAVTAGDFAPDCPRPLPCLEGITVEMALDRLGRAGLVPGRP